MVIPVAYPLLNACIQCIAVRDSIKVVVEVQSAPPCRFWQGGRGSSAVRLSSLKSVPKIGRIERVLMTDMALWVTL